MADENKTEKPEILEKPENSEKTEKTTASQMTLKQLLEIMATRDLTPDELTTLNNSRTSIVETIKMALDNYGQTDEILKKLSDDDSVVEPTIDEIMSSTDDGEEN